MRVSSLSSHGSLDSGSLDPARLSALAHARVQRPAAPEVSSRSSPRRLRITCARPNRVAGLGFSRPP